MPKCLFLGYMGLFKFHSCNLDFYIFYPFSCCIIAICSWALGSFMIISHVSSCLSQKLHTLFHFGCVTVLGPRSCLCTQPMLSSIFWLWSYGCFVVWQKTISHTCFSYLSTSVLLSLWSTFLSCVNGGFQEFVTACSPPPKCSVLGTI